MAKRKTFDEAVAWCESTTVDKGGFSQDRNELRWLFDHVEELQPKVLVEIGSWRGFSLLVLGQCVQENGLIVSIDTSWSTAEGSVLETLTLTHLRNRCEVVRINQNSHDPPTLATLKSILGGRAIDFLHIDADHQYASVRADYEIYSPLVRDGGLIALHDINAWRPEMRLEVKKYWRELKKGKQTEEIALRDNDWGIGVIWKGKVS